MRCLNCKLSLCDREDRTKYCDNQCQQDFQFKEIIKKWKSGQKIGDRVIKRYLRIKYKDRCCKCGWNKKNLVTKICPVEMNHIDGNSANFQEKNLELLCPNCHSLTSNYKALNKGNGRFSRLQRFREGKSY
jgi:hypothetical protein